MKLELHNADCMEVMARYPDNYFDLAVVDPPYGIGANKMTLGNGKRKVYRGNDDWDSEPPDASYFIELIRTSNHQVIWGANHFISKLGIDSSCWLFWDKGTGSNDFADGELAWTSFKKTVRKYFQSWVGANAKEKNEIDRIHPTQKPVELYKWIYQNYAKEGMRILDTHLGSGSNAIAAYEMNMGEFVGCELDHDYFMDAKKRIDNALSQQKLFA